MSERGEDLFPSHRASIVLEICIAPAGSCLASRTLAHSSLLVAGASDALPAGSRGPQDKPPDPSEVQEIESPRITWCKKLNLQESRACAAAEKPTRVYPFFAYNPRRGSTRARPAHPDEVTLCLCKKLNLHESRASAAAEKPTRVYPFSAYNPRRVLTSARPAHPDEVTLCLRCKKLNLHESRASAAAEKPTRVYPFSAYNPRRVSTSARPAHPDEGTLCLLPPNLSSTQGGSVVAK
ncbi:uncharacterized protein [Mobula birostris]|uniref:uncharacterized protein n=1 Tax=Mobula birostris TaxID=1983395 RepID=UPI003B28D82A